MNTLSRLAFSFGPRQSGLAARAIEAAVTARDFERVPSLMTDEWLSDVTLYGPASRVREGLEAWYDAGIRTPILVPSSAAGNQMKAFGELFACLER